MQLPTAYIASERFIHDELCRRVEASLLQLGEQSGEFRRTGRVAPFALLWPANAVRGDDGNLIDGVVLYELTGAAEGWAEKLQRAVERTNAYALCLVARQGTGVRALLESRHGTRRWLFSSRKRGGSYVLTNPSRADDEDRLGILWESQPPEGSGTTFGKT